MKVIEVTGSADVTGVNQLIVCNSSNAITLTFKRTAIGKYIGYYIKNIGAGKVTVTPVLNDFIDGQASVELAQYEGIFIIDYKTNNWITISNNYVP